MLFVKPQDSVCFKNISLKKLVRSDLQIVQGVMLAVSTMCPLTKRLTSGFLCTICCFGQKHQQSNELVIRNMSFLGHCIVSEAQARVASMETEMKERTGQLESLQSQLKLLEASQNKEQNHNSEVTLHFQCPNTCLCHCIIKYNYVCNLI